MADCDCGDCDCCCDCCDCDNCCDGLCELSLYACFLHCLEGCCDALCPDNCCSNNSEPRKKINNNSDVTQALKNEESRPVTMQPLSCNKAQDKEKQNFEETDVKEELDKSKFHTKDGNLTENHTETYNKNHE
ncbi:uncharacterized protein LOC115890708 [Sitophilus oryzae]|uniref:Uncharacterized protein LOC115890708 n=1 Tax=Sitophilus oryzae TaxID=7048 RepID=A0A6J2YUL7_SITOR|nr:uncharacterized protein LOC115890708 [Sitophilus oryzae]